MANPRALLTEGGPGRPNRDANQSNIRPNGNQLTYIGLIIASRWKMNLMVWFEMDIPTTEPPTRWKPYPIPLKYQKFIGEEIWLLENAGCISKTLSQ